MNLGGPGGLGRWGRNGQYGLFVGDGYGSLQEALANRRRLGGGSRPNALMLARMGGMCGIGGMGMMPMMPMMGLGMMPGMGMGVMPGMGLGRQPPEVMAAHAKGLADIEAKKEELRKKQLQAQIDKVNEVHERAMAVLDAAMPKVRGGK